MTRVLIVTTNFPRWEGDPHSPWLVELLDRLQGRGLEFEIIAPAFEGLSNQVINGMKVHRFRYAPARWETLTHEEGAPNKIRVNPLYLLLLPLYVLAGMFAAWRVGRAGKYDIIHVHWPMPQGLFGLIARWSGGGRLVATYYGADLVMAERFSFVQPFLRAFTDRCDDVAAISSYTAREVKRSSGRTPRVIPYGIHLPPEQDWPTTAGRILTVGRLVARKGHVHLIEAMTHLQQAPQAHLLIVGAGHEQPALEAAVARFELTDRVTLTGRVTDEKLEYYYQSCQVFVLPAIVDDSGDTEMLGMVSLEAMRYCKPVVASNVGGIPDIISEGETGLLVEQKDAAALADAIEQVLKDPALAHKLGHDGYRYANEHFSWDSVEAETLAMYGLTTPTPPNSQ